MFIVLMKHLTYHWGERLQHMNNKVWQTKNGYEMGIAFPRYKVFPCKKLDFPTLATTPLTLVSISLYIKFLF